MTRKQNRVRYILVFCGVVLVTINLARYPYKELILGPVMCMVIIFALYMMASRNLVAVVRFYIKNRFNLHQDALSGSDSVNEMMAKSIADRDGIPIGRVHLTLQFFYLVLLLATGGLFVGSIWLKRHQYFQFFLDVFA